MCNFIKYGIKEDDSEAAGKEWELNMDNEGKYNTGGKRSLFIKMWVFRITNYQLFKILFH